MYADSCYFIIDHLLCDRVTENCDHTASGHRSITIPAAVAATSAADAAGRAIHPRLQLCLAKENK